MALEALSFWRGRRVFLTGHTGFKGAWLCRMLTGAGAELTGYALAPPTDPSLFVLSGVEERMHSVTGDVRAFAPMLAAFRAARPEVVIHMAAQPLVLEGYRDPAATYETNVMGTVHLMECVRLCGGVRSLLNVTTDKVYHNNEWEWGYREDDALGGKDPYSNSKACSELVTKSYRASFFDGGETAVSTVRSGNVIGGGDFAADRILPDCVRAAQANKPVRLRNPGSTRPYQHVLEALTAYLLIAERQAGEKGLGGSYNVGPGADDCVTTGALAELFCRLWGEGLRWESEAADRPPEACFLKLDSARVGQTFGWRPRWDVATAVEKTVEWTRQWLRGAEVGAVMDRQIAAYLSAPSTAAPREAGHGLETQASEQVLR